MPKNVKFMRAPRSIKLVFVTFSVTQLDIMKGVIKVPSKHIRWCFVLLALFTGVCISCAFFAFGKQDNVQTRFRDRIANTVKATDRRMAGNTQYGKLKQPAMVPLSKTAGPALSARLLLPGARIEGLYTG